MTDSPGYPDSDGRDNSGVERARQSTTGIPRWVQMFGIITGVVVLLFIILVFTRGPGGHTPFRHFGGQAPSGGGRR